MASKRKLGGRGRRQSFSWAQAFRDILVTSMNRGQLPLLGLMGMVALVILKMPEGDVSELLFASAGHLRDGELLGFGLSFLLAVGWFLHSKSLRRKFSLEYERIGREKSDLQGILTGVVYKSSDVS